MKISQKQISGNGEEKLIYSQEDSLVSHLALQAGEEERKITVISGQSLNELYEKSDHVGLLVKMLLGSYQWYSPARRLIWKHRQLCSQRVTRTLSSSRSSLLKPSAGTLKKKDIPSNRSLFRLVPSELPTDEIEYGLLPTITASDFKKRGPNSKQQGLPEVLSQMLPTPQAADASVGSVIGQNDHFILTKNGVPRKINKNGQNGSVGLARIFNLLCTPTATDWKGGSTRHQKTFQRSSLRCEVHADYGTGKTSHLNPLFVEEMMGFPKDWILKPFLRELASQAGAQSTTDGERNL